MIGEVIYRERVSRGLTLKAAAALVGISVTQLQAVETGQRPAQAWMLRRLGEAFPAVRELALARDLHLAEVAYRAYGGSGDLPADERDRWVAVALAVERAIE